MLNSLIVVVYLIIKRDKGMVDIMKKNTSDETVERFVTFDIYEEKIADLEKINSDLEKGYSDLKSENERLKLQLKNKNKNVRS